MNKWNCARCGKDLYEVMRTDNGGSVFPIDPKGTKNRRWVCNKCINRNEIPDDVFDVTNDISEALTGKSLNVNAEING